MPFGGPCAESLLESVQELARQRNFRHQDHRLFALTECFGHGLEIDFRFARSRYAFEQGDGERTLFDRFDKGVDRILLAGRKAVGGEIGVRCIGYRTRKHGFRHQGAFVDKAIDHRNADACQIRQSAFGIKQAAFRRRHHPGASGGEAFGGRAQKPNTDLHAFRAINFRPAQRHTNNRAARRERVAGDPIDKLPQGLKDRRCIGFGLDAFEIGRTT